MRWTLKPQPEKEKVEKINQADALIFQSDKQLKEYGEKLSEGNKTAIEGALAELKVAHAAQDLAGIDAGLEKLNTAWTAASQEMYAAGAETEGGEPAQSADANASDIISMNSTVTSAEVYAGDNLNTGKLSLRFADVENSNAFEIYQNEPNPCRGKMGMVGSLPLAYQGADADVTFPSNQNRKYDRFECAHDRFSNDP